MTKNNKLNMVLFNKYVTCIMAFFTPFNYFPHFVSFTPTLPLCYSHKTLRKNYRMKEKKIFFVYDCFSLSRFIEGVKKITS